MHAAMHAGNTLKHRPLYKSEHVVHYKILSKVYLLQTVEDNALSLRFADS